MRRTSAIFATLALITIPAAAQPQNTDASLLAQLRSFTIVVENLEAADESRCSVTRTGLYTSLRSALNQSDIAIVDNGRATDGLIYLNVTVLSNCTAFISLEVKTVAKVEKTGARIFAPVWERGRLRTGFSGVSGGAAIRQSVEETAKLLVDDWSSVNAQPR